jgi:hypothetical protein
MPPKMQPKAIKEIASGLKIHLSFRTKGERFGSHRLLCITFNPGDQQLSDDSLTIQVDGIQSLIAKDRPSAMLSLVFSSRVQSFKQEA